MNRKPLKSKLIDVFKMMYGNQFEEFDKFVRSPYFGCRLTTIRFYSELKKHSPDFNISKEELFENFYRRKPESLGELDIIRKMCDELYMLAERYFAIFTFEKSVEKESEIYTLTQLKNIKNRKIFEKKVKLMDIKIHEPETGITEKFFYRLIKYNYEKYQFYNFDYKVKNMKGIISERAVYNLCNFLFETSRILTNAETFKERFNHTEEITPILVFLRSVNWNEFLGSINKFNTQYQDILTLYTLRLIIALNMEPEKHIYKYKELLFNNSHRLYKNVKSAFYIILINYYNSKKEEHDLKLVKELNEVYNRMLAEKLYEGEIRIRIKPENISAIVINNCELGKYDTAQDIMNKYIPYLDKDIREDMFNYCSSIVEFYKKNFVSSLDYINKSINLIFLLKYNMYELKLMLFYELDYIEPAISLIDSYRHYLAENKHVTDKYELPRRNFLKIYNMLINLKLTTVKAKKSEIEERVNSGENILHIRWLNRKIMELGKPAR